MDGMVRLTAKFTLFNWSYKRAARSNVAGYGNKIIFVTNAILHNHRSDNRGSNDALCCCKYLHGDMQQKRGK